MIANWKKILAKRSNRFLIQSDKEANNVMAKTDIL